MATTLSTGSTVDIAPRWSLVLRVAAARGFLAIVAGLMLWAVVPVLAGWQPQLIMTGSMMPRIAPGDVVVTRPVDPTTLELGQVVTVDDPDHEGRTRTHRIVRIADDGELVLRGDANDADDSSHIPLDTVHGVGVLRVPYVGRPLLWLGNGQYLPLIALLLALTWSVATVIRGTGAPSSLDQDDQGGDEGGDDTTGPKPTDESRGPRVVIQRRRRIAAGVASAIVATMAMGSAPADAAYKQASANPTSAFAAAASFGSYLDTVLGDAPYLYWRLNEKSGFSVADSSGNSRGGSIQNSTTFGVAGALTSDAANTAIRLSNERITQTGSSSAAPSRFSIEAWIKTTGTTGGRIMGFGNQNGSTDSTTTDRVLYLGNNGRVYFGVGTAKDVVSSAGALNDGSWHHLVATYTTGNNGMELYVDGSLASQSKGTLIDLSGYWRAGGEVMSGWTANPNDSFYDGTLDEVAVYTSVLTPAQVSEHYSEAG